MGRKLFVGNLSFDTTSGDLETLFGEVGTCESAAVITDRESGRSRGFGFVEMSSNDEAQKAISALNGREVQGRQPNAARPRSARAAVVAAAADAATSGGAVIDVTRAGRVAA